VGLREMHKSFYLENLKEGDSGRLSHTWEDNIKMDSKEIDCGNMN
jgi:hypothetical protein